MVIVKWQNFVENTILVQNAARHYLYVKMGFATFARFVPKWVETAPLRLRIGRDLSVRASGVVSGPCRTPKTNQKYHFKRKTVNPCVGPCGPLTWPGGMREALGIDFLVG